MKEQHSRRQFLCAASALAASGLLLETPAAAEFFDGVDASGKPIMEQAQKRIEQIRKGDFTVRLIGPDGAPISGRATIRLVSHEFHFGANLTAVSAKLPEDSAVRAEGLRVIEELFNFARVGNFWSHMAPQKDGPLDWERVDRDVKWAQERGLPMRFHCLIYNVPDSVPSWYHEVKSTEEWWQLIEGRIRATAERYGNVIHEYDVINEMVSNPGGARRERPLFPSLDDPQNGARILRLARKYLPDATLVSLEAGLITTADSNKHFHDVLNYQKALLALDPPLDVIGYQGHFHSGGMPFPQGHPKAGPEGYKMRGISEGLDCLAALGKPIHITEFSGPSRSSRKGKEGQPGLTPEEVAAWVVNFYTLAFSKPYLREIIFWNVVDGVGGQAIDAGLLTKEGTKKPLYYALRRLLKEEWSSCWQGDLTNGTAVFRGFFGNYEVVVEGYQSARLTIGAAGECEATVHLQPR
jgi:GH35 family endo-1,4-beta-xylanase